MEHKKLTLCERPMWSYDGATAVSMRPHLNREKTLHFHNNWRKQIGVNCGCHGRCTL